jgi:hypothetical protein
MAKVAKKKAKKAPAKGKTAPKKKALKKAAPAKKPLAKKRASVKKPAAKKAAAPKKKAAAKKHAAKKAPAPKKKPVVHAKAGKPKQAPPKKTASLQKPLSKQPPPSNQPKDDGTAFLPDPRSERHARVKDDLAEELGEEFVEGATSGESVDDARDAPLVEEDGGPFVTTSAESQYGTGVDASNPEDAEREPFPLTHAERH